MTASVQYMTDPAGNRTGVLMSCDDYEQLMEDLEDLAAVAERRDEASIPHEQFIEDLKKDGLLPS